MRILVTGITGFIGASLGKYFSSDDDVYVLARDPSKVILNGLLMHVIQGDLNSPDVIFGELKRIRPEVCIHLAWEGIPDYGYEMSLRNFMQGVRLLHCLIEECGCCKVVVGGSCFEYGKAFGSCREDDAVTTNSYFVWAKRALCDLGMMLSAKYGASFVWMRFFYVYGPGQRVGSLVPTIAAALMKGERPMVRSPLNANDFIYIDDIAEALMRATRKEILSGIYNLGTGRSVPVWKVCEIVEKFLGREPVCAGELKDSPIPAAVDFWADTEKTEKVFGWRAGTSLERGIAQCINSLGGNG